MTKLDMTTDIAELKHTYVYPGHPVTIAYCIAGYFSSYDEAISYETRPDGRRHDYCRALESNDIPGAGSHVYMGLRLLRNLREGMEFEEAIKRADQSWVEACSNGYVDRTPSGQIQADPLKPLLAEMKAFWAKSS